MNLRRIVGAALSGVVLAGSASVLVAPAASATSEHLSTTAESYVDSAAPSSALEPDWDTDLPVGARVIDGMTHLSKSYVTFDLSGVTGVPIASARLTAAEQSVANCKKNRASTQAWLTGTATAPTWDTQPAELVKLPTPVVYDTCTRGSLAWNATTALRQAIRDGRTSVTFVLRLPDTQQADPAFARSYSQVSLDVDTDQPPDTATYLSVGGRHCGPDPVYVDTLNPPMSGNTTDPEYDTLAVRFEWWPTAHPAQKQHLDLTGVSAGGETETYFPADLVENTQYTWHMRVSDAYNAGQWSANCSFIPDVTRPSVAPVVSSTDYPRESTGPGHGGSGIPGTFTFTANGVPDVVGYGWQFDQMSGFVDAPQPGAPVTLQLTPNASGPTQLLVYSYDRAGQRSPAADYRFWVTDNSPTVSCSPQSAFVGQPRQCTVTPGSSGVTGYVYTLDYGNPDVPVPANPDGTAAFTFTPRSTSDGHTHVYVRATLDDGRRSDPAEVVLDTDGGEPTVDVPPPPVAFGAPVQITMHAKLPDSRTFTYEWNYEGEHTIPVGPDGTATITVQPNGSGYFYLFVHTTDGSGLQSWTATAQVQVARTGRR
ncbi:hypothetical protein [Labedaea rhizosphaerae]|uniref:Ig-like domain-containing protein n=1 Tax=Labedaea rhizosphaerae TaxID=598644 RepID=A0A4R6SKR5_LABRH|nr:hypothetical protein [Labedaea rhizosphaerae]TDQ05016.1 hypothetical protein EV186_101980 [Labedaea rhizosphaerae]